MQFDPLPATVDNVRRETQRDPVLAQVYEMTSKGRPYNEDPELNPFLCVEMRSHYSQAALCGE